MLVQAYQTTIAGGLHAITYNKEDSECTYQLDEKTKTIDAECFIPLTNHSNDEVQFDLEFIDQNDNHSLTDGLMNMEGPYTLVLEPHMSKTFQIKAKIDVRDLKQDQYIQSGGSQSIPIKLIKDGAVMDYSGY